LGGKITLDSEFLLVGALRVPEALCLEVNVPQTSKSTGQEASEGGRILGGEIALDSECLLVGALGVAVALHMRVGVDVPKTDKGSAKVESVGGRVLSGEIALDVERLRGIGAPCSAAPRMREVSAAPWPHLCYGRGITT
jgi:hypothetical protein